MKLLVSIPLCWLVLVSWLAAGPVVATSVSPSVDAPSLTVQEEAQAFRTAIEAAEKDLSQKLEATFATVEESIRAIEPKVDHVRAEGRVLNDLRALVRELRLQGDSVFKSQQAFVGSASSFAEKLSAGPAHFRQVAAEFEGFAADETYSELAADYRHVASSFGALADRCEQQLRRVNPAIEEYRVNLVYIERSLLFLARFEQALESVPDLAEFERLEGSLAELARYVRGFERLQGSLRAFDERLHAPAGAPSAQRVPALGTPARKSWDLRLARRRP